MNKEELIEFVRAQTMDSFDKTIVAKWLEENYPAEDNINVFHILGEMSNVFDLVDSIAKSNDPDANTDSIKGLIYAVALVEARRYKIDTQKVEEAFDINELKKKYIKTKKENEE